MRLYDEILKKLGGGESELAAGARYTVLPGRGGYFQGVKTVSEFSPERVILCFRRAADPGGLERCLAGSLCDVCSRL